MKEEKIENVFSEESEKKEMWRKQDVEGEGVREKRGCRKRRGTEEKANEGDVEERKGCRKRRNVRKKNM